MATAFISPSAPYHHHHQQQPQDQHQHYNSYSSGYLHSVSATSISGTISPVEPRRPSDDSEAGHAHQQSPLSLPSILEVFSKKKPLGYAPPLPSAPLPPPQSLPSPFTSAPPPKPFADLGSPDKNSPPRTLHASSSTFSRPDTHPAFADPVLPALASRPVPHLLNTFPGHYASPPVTLAQVEAQHRPAEAQSLSARHRLPPPPRPLPSLYLEMGRLSPEQLLPSAYSISLGYSAGPRRPLPYEARGSPPGYGKEADYPPHRASDHKAAFEKHFQTNGYQDALQVVGFGSELRKRHAQAVN